MKRSFVLVIPMLLAGCQAISDGADSLGSHLPTFGERCYHWQCFTEGGQRASDRNKAIETLSKTPPKPNTPPPVPINKQVAPTPVK